MRREEAEPVDRVAALRDAFDRSFAVERIIKTEEVDDLLGLRIGGDAYAVRVTEVAGLFVDRKILRIPSPLPELLGLSGLRGVVLPIYSLAVLLGYASKVVAPRWLVVAGADQQVGLAFEQFEGYLRVPRSQLGVSAPERLRSHTKETASLSGEARAIVSIASIMNEVAKRVGIARPKKEH